MGGSQQLKMVFRFEFAFAVMTGGICAEIGLVWCNPLKNLCLQEPGHSSVAVVGIFQFGFNCAPTATLHLP